MPTKTILPLVLGSSASGAYEDGERSNDTISDLGQLHFIAFEALRDRAMFLSGVALMAGNESYSIGLDLTPEHPSDVDCVFMPEDAEQLPETIVTPDGTERSVAQHKLAAIRARLCGHLNHYCLPPYGPMSDDLPADLLRIIDTIGLDYKL
tara:strand:+ start:538 stop:990 length:453 start_codon:yes stop_codon:yes gene_type:complete